MLLSSVPFFCLSTPGELVKCRRNMSYDIFSMCFWGTGQVNDQVLESLLMFHLGHPNIFDNSYDFIFLSLE